MTTNALLSTGRASSALIDILVIPEFQVKVAYSKIFAGLGFDIDGISKNRLIIYRNIYFYIACIFIENS